MRGLCAALLLSLVSSGSAAAAVPVVLDGGIVNSADYTTNVSPGIVMAIFGANFSSATSVAQSFPLPTTIGGVRVEVLDGSRTLAAPLFFVSPGQTNFLLPYEVTSDSVQVRLLNAEGATAWVGLPVVKRSPRLLTTTADGRGEPALTHANYQLVSAANPAAAGEVLLLFLTGLGEVAPSIASGQAAGDGTSAHPLNYTTKQPSVLVDGAAAKVLFSGLAPGFAGLFQINFEVPPGTAPGVPGVAVRMDEETSQDGVAFYVAPATALLSSTAVSSSGGSVAGAGLVLTVPSGALSAPQTITLSRVLSGAGAPAPPVTEVFSLSGLPSSTGQPLTLSIPLIRPLQSGGTPVLVIQEMGPEGGRTFFDARVEGDRIVANLPRRSAPAANEAIRAAADSDAFELFVLELLTGDAIQSGDAIRSQESSHFKLVYAPKFLPGPYDAQYVLVGAELAIDAAGGWGFSTDFKVTLDLTNTASGGECGGRVVYSSFGERVTLHLDASIAMSDTLSSYHQTSFVAALSAKAAHLAGHYITQPSKPSARVGTRWIWMDEAIASLLEESVLVANVAGDPIPQQVTRNWNVDEDGLEYSVFSADPNQLRNHGAGATRFLQWLMARHGREIVGQAYKFKSGYLPAEALRQPKILQGPELDLSTDWKAWVQERNAPNAVVREYTRSKLAAVRLGLRRGALAGTQAQSLTSTWASPNLSAKLFAVTFEGKPAANLKLAGQVSGGASVSATYYKIPASGPPSILSSSLTLPDNVNVQSFEAGDQIWVVVVDNQFVSPFTAKGQVTVTIQLKAPDAQLESMKLLPGVRFRLGGITMTCSDGSSSFSCGADFLFTNHDWASTATPKVLPISWSGTTFTVDAAFNATNGTVAMYMTATYDPDTKELRDGYVRRFQTYTSNGSTVLTEMRFRTLPFKQAQVPGRYTWEMNAPAELLEIRATLSGVKYESVSGNTTMTVTTFSLASNATLWVTLENVN